MSCFCFMRFNFLYVVLKLDSRWLQHLPKLKFQGTRARHCCLECTWSCSSHSNLKFLFSWGPAAANGGCAKPTWAFLFTLKWLFLLHISLSLFHIKQWESSLSSVTQNHAEGYVNSQPFVFPVTKECTQQQSQQFRLQCIHIYKQTCTYKSSNQNYALHGL